MWYSNIPDLSENFIESDDDYYFLNSIPEDWFFENNIPMTSRRTLRYHIYDVDSQVANWQHVLSNSRKFVADYT